MKMSMNEKTVSTARRNNVAFRAATRSKRRVCTRRFVCNSANPYQVYRKKYPFFPLAGIPKQRFLCYHDNMDACTVPRGPALRGYGRLQTTKGDCIPMKLRRILTLR